jgi:hypothetical protein
MGVIVGEGVGVQVEIGAVGVGGLVGSIETSNGEGGKGFTASTPNPISA